MGEARTKSQRRADIETVGRYHEVELSKLLEHVREGFDRYEAGEIDAFELDELIHQYKRAAQKLWSACVGGGAHAERMARTLEWQTAEGELPNWWEIGAPWRRAGG